jgi:cytoskeletal protein RodZ
MIGRITQRRAKAKEDAGPKGFDDFELRLGDVMRGERATMGKSLLDVQRELRIKASYIAAIENTDPTVFDTPGFIAGYVRSYARYLNLDPDKAFDDFCRESGFEVAHGMSAEASGRRAAGAPIASGMGGLSADAFTKPNTPFAPVSGTGGLGHVEMRAVGSTLVLMGLIAGIGWGGYSVLKEIQQVQLAPVEQAPAVLAELDPLERMAPNEEAAADLASVEALDRLYRPQALDVPVLVARDAPISTLDPNDFGSFSVPSLPEADIAFSTLDAAIEEAVAEAQPVPQVVEEAAPQLEMVAVRPSWVRVRAADGSVIFEGIMDAGQRYAVPATEEPPVLRTGESSAIYFALNGEHFGPVGARGEVTKNVEMSIDAVSGRFAVAKIEDDRDLARMVAELEALPAE